jgi:hypothetical protein
LKSGGYGNGSKIKKVGYRKKTKVAILEVNTAIYNMGQGVRGGRGSSK